MVIHEILILLKYIGEHEINKITKNIYKKFLEYYKS